MHDTILLVIIMEKELFECCKMMVQLLKQLKDSGQITEEEYEKHIEKKVEFTNNYLCTKKIKPIQLRKDFLK